MILSACGLICDECSFFGKECVGCKIVKGQTFWAKEMMPDHTCPLFNCSANVKQLNDCGSCAELPCAMFRKMKDPNSTEEEHQLSLVQRVDRLKTNA
jgi:hypothetical protein